MTTPPTDPLLRFIRQLAETQRCQVLSDRELLRLHATKRDEAAFAVLVQRYGPRLLRICRRVLHNHHDAEDICQAAFLVLARKAGSRRWQARIGYWLYKVAYRLALDAKEASLRRHAGESQATVRQAANPVHEMCLRDAAAALNEELARLPDRLRLPVLLCHLEGQTRDQAAQQLGWSLRTFQRRLARALKILRGRLEHRGIGLSTALVTVGLVEGNAVAAMPALWIGATVRAAVSFAASKSSGGAEAVSKAALLAKGVLHMMLLTKVKLGSLLLLSLLALGAGTMLAHQALEGKVKEPPQQAGVTKPPAEQPSQPMVSREETARVDLYGDPLPPGALARLGTVRFRHLLLNMNLGKSMTFTPDGKTLLVAEISQPPRLLDAISGKPQRRFWNVPQDQIWLMSGARLSPDGCMVVGLLWDKKKRTRSLSLWETATGKLIRQFSYQQPNGREELCCDFSPDSKTVVAQCGDNLVLWEIATGRSLWTQHDSMYKGKCLTFTPDGKTIASSKEKGGIQLLNSRTGHPLRTLGHSWPLDTIAFSANGGTLLVGYQVNQNKQHRSVYLWNIVTGKEEWRLDEPNSSFSWPIFSPDNKIVALCYGGTAEICLLDAATGKLLRCCQDSVVARMQGIMGAFSPDSKVFAALDGTVIRYWEVASGKVLPRAGGHENVVTSVNFTEDGKTLVSNGADNTARIWDTQTSRQRLTLSRGDIPWLDYQYQKELATHAAISTNGRIVASVCVESNLNGGGITRTSIRLWDSKTGRELRRFETPKGYLGSPVFSPNDQILAAPVYTEHGDVTACKWEIATGKQLGCKFSGKTQNQPVKMGFSSDDTLLALSMVGNSKVCNVMEVTTGRMLFSISSQEDEELIDMCPSSDWQTIAVSVESKTARNGTDFPVIYLYPVYRSKWSRVRLGKPRIITSPGRASFETLKFSPNGKMLAATSRQRSGLLHDGSPATVHIWETASGRERARLTGHEYGISCLAFSPDGRQLATGCYDSTILLWDVTGRLHQSSPASVWLTKHELETLWADLASADSVRAGRSMWTLATAGSQAISLCSTRLRPVPAIKADTLTQITQLIADLDNDAYAVRQQARQELEALGEIAEPHLRQALDKQPSLELRRSVDHLLAFLEEQRAKPLSGETLRMLRAIEILEHIGTPEARQLLKVLSSGAHGARQTEEAKAALARLSRRTARQ